MPLSEGLQPLAADSQLKLSNWCTVTVRTHTHCRTSERSQCSLGRTHWLAPPAYWKERIAATSFIFWTGVHKRMCLIMTHLFHKKPNQWKELLSVHFSHCTHNPSLTVSTMSTIVFGLNHLAEREHAGCLYIWAAESKGSARGPHVLSSLESFSEKVTRATTEGWRKELSVCKWCKYFFFFFFFFYGTLKNWNV